MTKEELIGKEFKCLDKGFVRLIDVMGDDSSIVQSARVSYGAGTKTYREDRTLIRYLMRHQHTSPFEMVEFKFHIKLPIFVARQWIRHRTANVNEYSGRYSEMPDEFYVPDANSIRTQSSINRQGRSEEIIELEKANEIINRLNQTQSMLYAEYRNLLDQNIARELSRINLPLSTYTQWYWKIDLHNLMRFLKLRLDKTAQYEIREYAKIIAEIVKQIVPVTYEAFEDYVLQAVSLSRQEQLALKEIIKQGKREDNPYYNEMDKLEKLEFEEKIKKILE